MIAFITYIIYKKKTMSIKHVIIRLKSNIVANYKVLININQIEEKHVANRAESSRIQPSQTESNRHCSKLRTL